jgi:hypothetical protein
MISEIGYVRFGRISPSLPFSIFRHTGRGVSEPRGTGCERFWIIGGHEALGNRGPHLRIRL